jgi:hypothetical protein
MAEQHADDQAVDQFAEAMKRKLKRKRDEGRGGWDDPGECAVEDLARMLVDHVRKGDPVDIANFSMMLFHRRARRIQIREALSDWITASTEVKVIRP